MKKLLVLFGVLAFLPVCSYAYMNETETSDIENLRGQGFSDSLLEVVDLTKSHNVGSGKKFTRYYKHKEHHYLGKGYTYLKQYVDPIQDTGYFGEGQINFTNTWNGDATKYSSERVPNVNKADNL